METNPKARLCAALAVVAGVYLLFGIAAAILILIRIRIQVFDSIRIRIQPVAE
jgi:hypothetical protein